jgi:hypothetical protein
MMGNGGDTRPHIGVPLVVHGVRRPHGAGKQGAQDNGYMQQIMFHELYSSLCSGFPIADTIIFNRRRYFNTDRIFTVAGIDIPSAPGTFISRVGADFDLGENTLRKRPKTWKVCGSTGRI